MIPDTEEATYKKLKPWWFSFGGFNEGPGRSFICFSFWVLGGTLLQNNFTDSTRFFSPFFLQNCYIHCGVWYLEILLQFEGNLVRTIYHHGVSMMKSRPSHKNDPLLELDSWIPGEFQRTS